MKSVDFLIVGGSAAGTTAAEVIRQLKPQASITIITDENHEEYSRVLIPHYIRGKVSREQVFLKKPEWYEEKGIELIKGIKVIKLDSGGHGVDLSNGEQIGYKKLLIAIGGDVNRLNIAGSDLANILYLRTIKDADSVIEAAKKSKKGLVLGGGFVSLDFATGFRVNGVEKVVILTRDPYFWSGHLDPESGRLMKNLLLKNGVEIMTGEEADSFFGQEKVEGAVTKSGKKLEADIVGVGIGIKPDLEWLEKAGIKTNRAILTNEYLETNMADVYAAGDCAEFHDVFFERQHIMGNWANATSQGAAVGKTMIHSASSGQVGQRTVYETISSYSDTFFDNSYSFIGVTDEKFADEIIVRGSVENQKMARIFIKKMNGISRIVGATVINDPAEVSPITAAIKNKIDILKFKNRLSDPAFDLKEMLA
ncbi:hypothetical protein A3D07_01610 [Candidatus Curtissbacteria bacterium RIFCSPHIGHO2_02_FULL_42_15]|uniref:FAD/NAD(P)-binding domain-containing protein n=1 Tax=Candidatus Curtissbacteria bacterium RIFCSPHIGHO2_02_FULL_42_15 TaxID=1797716 RepID=A0A1F5GFJ9_9BACT|nr:MAG: hypothetical protein A3D07_01610 [Candidatus Curtissbacteria bacterium RIFCSPHIGHO2_02_FULL_42_15]